MLHLYYHHNLLSYNTFHLSAYAHAFCKMTNQQQLYQICSLPEFSKDRVLWLGGGSNILFMTEHYSGLVVHIANKGIRALKQDEHHVYIEAQAGEIWHNFVNTTLAMGLSGLENLSLIPGTVGATPIQNIGAYGVEIKDVIHSVRCFDIDKQVFFELNNTDCYFAYRDSIFKHEGKNKYIIVSVVFKLNKQFNPNIHYGDLAHTLQVICHDRPITATDVAQAVCQIRRQKLPDPQVTGNVGSFYKNPIISATLAQKLLQSYPNMPYYPQENGQIKLAAGWLIDQCGFKGKNYGGAAVHEKQALVLINQNHATATDVQVLSDWICTEVQKKFGVTLYAEPNFII